MLSCLVYFLGCSCSSICDPTQSKNDEISLSLTNFRHLNQCLPNIFNQSLTIGRI